MLISRDTIFHENIFPYRSIKNLPAPHSIMPKLVNEIPPPTPIPPIVTPTQPENNTSSPTSDNSSLND